MRCLHVVTREQSAMCSQGTLSFCSWVLRIQLRKRIVLEAASGRLPGCGCSRNALLFAEWGENQHLRGKLP